MERIFHCMVAQARCPEFDSQQLLAFSLYLYLRVCVCYAIILSIIGAVEHIELHWHNTRTSLAPRPEEEEGFGPGNEAK